MCARVGLFQMLDKRTLGKTAIEVSPIGIGVMLWSHGKGLLWSRMPKISEVDKETIIREAIDGGVNFFDTAEIYGGGNSESSLVKALKANGVEDKDVVIGTKWNPMLRFARNIRKSIKDRLHFLNGYTIDLFMVHNPTSFSSIKAQMGEMAKLVKENKIRSVGISNYNAKGMRTTHDALEKHDIPLAVNQVNYSLIRRGIEHNGILETAKELGVTITAYSPLGSGLLTGKYHDNPALLDDKFSFFRRGVKKNIEKSRSLIETLKDIGKVHGLTPGQVALNWLVTYNGDTVITIPGATKVNHAKENAGAMTFELSKTELEEIAEASEIFG
jgi:aryl-alcohol dehydrogenase-like predicted oxidoreductase